MFSLGYVRLSKGLISPTWLEPSLQELEVSFSEQGINPMIKRSLYIKVVVSVKFIKKLHGLLK